MHRRSPLGRLPGFLVAVWFAVFQSEPMVVHACAMHDGGPGHGATGVAAASVVDAHADHGSGSRASATPPGEDESPDRCTCPGGCTAASAVALPVAAESAITGAGMRDAGSHSRRPETIRTPGADHVHPFANGPPTT
jgi:hypothetical protein